MYCIKKIIQKQLTEEENVSSCKKSVYTEYGLPCEHMFLKAYILKKETLITENYIPAIYISKPNKNITSNDDDDVKNTVVEIKLKHNESYSYSETMSQLSQMAQDACRI